MKASAIVDRLLEAKPKADRHRLGRCYEEAGRYVSGHPDAKLVHGHLTNPFGRGLAELEHGWVEEGDRVWEPTSGQWWEKETFERLFKAIKYAVYTHAEVIRKTLETRNWGPWD